MEKAEFSISGITKDKNRELIYKALIDPAFRKKLKRDPAAELGVTELSKENEAEIRLVLAAVRGIENHIGALADELLCANGGNGVPT